LGIDPADPIHWVLPISEAIPIILSTARGSVADTGLYTWAVLIDCDLVPHESKVSDLNIMNRSFRGEAVCISHGKFAAWNIHEVEIWALPTGTTGEHRTVISTADSTVTLFDAREYDSVSTLSVSTGIRALVCVAPVAIITLLLTINTPVSTL